MVFIDSLFMNGPHVRRTSDTLEADYEHTTASVQTMSSPPSAKVTRHNYTFRTALKPRRLGVLLVGWGGNNGSTLTAAAIANRRGLTWKTKCGVRTANYFGSLLLSSTTRVGSSTGNDSGSAGHHNDGQEEVFLPLRALLPMVDPSDILYTGWDINGANLADAMERSQVLDYDLQRQLRDDMQPLTPMPSIYYGDFIAANQGERADNVIPGQDKGKHLETIRTDIRRFKKLHELDHVVVVWTATTERFSRVIAGVNDTADNLLAAIRSSHDEVAPSTVFATAAILEGAPYINGSPQNTLVPGCIALAERESVFVGGDDFKSGQTKLKSVLVDFLVGAGLKPTAIVSYNHLGNNDGRNLSAPSQFRAKEVSKSNVVEDVVRANGVLYGENERPDHVVVIKYVPSVGDSKRAMDEYTSEIFMGGMNTLVVHNTCEDSLLAAPLIIDLVLLCELLGRVSFRVDACGEFAHVHYVMALLSYLLKAPLVPNGTPVVNALFRQRAAIENFLRVCAGLPVESDLRLEHWAAAARTSDSE